MKVKRYDEEYPAICTLEIGEWAITYMADVREEIWHHKHDVATGRIVRPWPWQNGCDSCGAEVPDQIRQLAELQKIKIYRDYKRRDVLV